MRREWRRKLAGDLDGWKEQREVKGSHPSLLVSNFLTMKLGILKTWPDFLLWFPWYCLIKMFSSLWKVPLLISFYLLVVTSFLYILGSLLFPMSSSLAKRFIFFNGLISSSIWVMSHKIPCTLEKQRLCLSATAHISCPVFCSWFFYLDVFAPVQMLSSGLF